MRGRVGAVLLMVAALAPAAPAAAEVTLLPGFSVKTYVTGEGFESGGASGAAGFPTTTTAAVDQAGALYLARTGRRYAGGEIEDLWPIYRVPAGGARLTRATEPRFLHGPPLWSPQVSAVRGGRDLFVTTFDRDRSVGVLYRLTDGRAQIVAGGTPATGSSPQLGQPEGVAGDSAGNLYVADRLRNVVVKLDASGRVVDPQRRGQRGALAAGARRALEGESAGGTDARPHGADAVGHDVRARGTALRGRPT